MPEIADRNEKPVIGMILKGFPRISETFISNEILLLEKNGFNLHLFSMRQPRETFSHESVHRIRAGVDYLPETLLRHLGKLLKDNAVLAAKDPEAYRGALFLAARRFRRTGKSATIKHLLQAGYVVNRLLPRRPVTHLHAHFAHSPTSVAMFAARLSGLPFSFTAHAKDIYTSDPVQLAEKLQAARFVVTCTEFNRRYLTRLAPELEKRIHRVYHGIDVGLFAGQKPIRTETRSPFDILTVARLTAKKGLPTVLEALKSLKETGFLFQHTLIGDGEDRSRIESLIGKLDLRADVQLLGTQPHDVVLSHYQRADAFVLGCEVAANGDRDGIPNVFMESMAMGVPVVATRVSAIPEIVSDGQTGLLVEPGRPDEMAAALRRILTDSELRKRVIIAARQRVTERFDNRVLIQRLVEIYKGQMSDDR